MQTFFVLQPLLDSNERIYGYELLLRNGAEQSLFRLNGGQAEGDSPLSVPAFKEIEDVTEGASIFIKCQPQALIGAGAAPWPRNRVVLEIPATQGFDEETATACRRLKDAGFLIALEGCGDTCSESQASLADIFKIKISGSTDRTRSLLMRRYQSKGAIFVAEGVETREQFQEARQQGFPYFQGRFFLCPQSGSSSELSPAKLVYLLVLNTVTKSEFDVQEVANAIKHDLALSYKLLQFLNSAQFAFPTQIRSVRHALLLLGQNEIRKWIGLISVSALGEGCPPILVSVALTRAAFCESLAPLVGAPHRQPDYFFVGLLSCMDVLLRRPMREVLAKVPIPPDAKGALMGEQNLHRDVLQTVLSYEQGRWDECGQLASKLGVKEEKLCEMYRQALHWSRQLGHEQ